jgi:hypothetical protein
MSKDEPRYEYRIRVDNPRGARYTPWTENPLTAEEMQEWREDFGRCEIAAERRQILYGEAEEFAPPEGNGVRP